MVKVTFEFKDDRVAEIDGLVAECGFGNRTELFNNALTLLTWVIKATKEGRAVASVDGTWPGKVYRELSMPFMSHLIVVP